MLEHLFHHTLPGPEPEAFAVLLLVHLNDLVTKAKAEGNALTDTGTGSTDKGTGSGPIFGRHRGSADTLTLESDSFGKVAR